MSDNARGYFGPGSISWQVYREPLILAGGIRALLLQVSHPSVADGVARYSHFKTDPFGRGYRTFAAMATIYFGSKKQAEQTASRLWRIHTAIKGDEPQAYSATDPELLLWVLATLTETTFQVYERMPLSGLPPDWQEQFYEESKIAARLLGIPEGAYPADLQAFKAYFNLMLKGDVLGSTNTCQEVAQAIVRHPRTPQKLAYRLATGWIPERLCEQLGIPILVDSAAKLNRMLNRFFWIYRLIPKTLRWAPAYHQALFRIARAEGKNPPLAGRFFSWLARRAKIPLGLER